MSIQSISNASASMQAMAGTQAARSQADSSSAVPRGVETRSENIEQNANVQRVPSAGELQEALEEVSKAVAPMTQSLQFSLDKESGRTVVKVMDTDTNEVIRQIPSEEVLAISKAVDKLKGLLIKQQA